MFFLVRLCCRISVGAVLLFEGVWMSIEGCDNGSAKAVLNFC